MADAISVSGPVSGSDKTLSFETGKLAPQSQGAVIGRIGDTMVLATANASKGVRDGQDFFPLTVDIEARAYSAGKIPGAVFRREGRPTDSAILTCRLIDRPLRPSFPEGFRNEVHVVGTIMAADQENRYDVLAINAASAALMLSGIPFDGPIGAVRIAFSQEGKWLPHSTYQEGEDSTFELVVAGRALPDGDVAIMMVEAGGTSGAWQYYQAGAPKVTEAVLASGLEEAKTWIRESIELQKELVAKAGARPPMTYELVHDYLEDVWEQVVAHGTDLTANAVTIADKTERNAALDEAAATIQGKLADAFPGREKEIKAAARSLSKKLMRKRVVDDGIRMDGRGAKDLRALSAEVDILPTAHGSALFQRGETQVLNVVTLGMPRSAQSIGIDDTMAEEPKKRFLHHYNMPPYANGETGRLGTNRRSTGHGLLGEKAMLPLVPSEEDFAYALRLVSEVLSSNGSTSMASVCAGSMAMMAAGVPTHAAVAGIAMGLIKDEGKYITLTDILGSEDAFGDMDFKVAGTSEFVTALQLDTKIDGLPADVLAQALEQAKVARLEILEVMNKAIAEPRDEVGPTAPKIISFEIPIDKIGEVIGPKGKVINAIQQETGADVNVDDDGMVGTVTIGSKDGEAVSEARRRIEMILDPPRAEIGAIYKGRVVNITKFGAFVNILPGRDGLVHISKLGQGKRVERVEDVVDLGDEIEVRVDDVDQQGKVSLSPVGDGGDAPADNGPPAGRGRSEKPEREPAPVAAAPRAEPASAADSDDSPAPVAGAATVSFEDTWQAEAAQEFGDLGPAGAAGASEERRGPRRSPRRGGRRP
jgi:polyribonucleotide nucleotidyltransferase